MKHGMFRNQLKIGVGLLVVILGLVSPEPLQADEVVESASALFRSKCVDCHDSSHDSGLDLSDFQFQPNDPANFETWVRIHDRVEAGDMPPDGDLKGDQKLSFISELSTSLTSNEQLRYSLEGRATQRRLNRYEYENVLRDLLGVPWIQIKDRLPEDGEKYRYNKVGEALDVSHVQMARYMSSADYAMREAMGAKLVRPQSTVRRYYARDEPSLISNFWPRENSTLSDRHSFPVLDGKAQPKVRRRDAPISNPESREQEAIGRVTSIFSDAGGYSWSQFKAPVSGRYRARFKGYSIWVSGGGIARWFFEGFGDKKAPVFHLPLWHRPNADEIWPGRRAEPIGIFARSSGQSRPLGEFDFGIDPTIGEIEAILVAGEVLQSDGQRLFRTRVNGTDEQYVNPLAQPDGMPGYAIQWMEIEGPLADANVTDGYQLLFGELPLVRQESGGVTLQLTPDAKKLLDEADGIEPITPNQEANGGRGRFRGRRVPTFVDVTVEVQSENPTEDAKRLLYQFMQRAYGRPIQEAHAERFLQLFHDQYDQGAGFARSMLTSYTAVLASSGFLFVDEQPGQLDDHALAKRLALFLWNSEPDDLLRQLANSQQLRQPDVLQEQTARMLDHQKSGRFVEAFTDYWLDLRKINDTSPSTTLYNDYELDDPLKLAAIDETRLFVKALIKEDLPARNIVDSDFTFLNERLARHYDIDGVDHADMRRVTLPDDSVRGGLMTQASVLKVTANGTTTSPVLRGNWITERILGVQIPPPPPVAAVEPDIRGAVTIREQLELHRADPSCSSCHSIMDPPGLALESFDVMGAFRKRYRAVNEEANPEDGIGMNGQAFAFHYSLPVDSAGVMADQTAFSGIQDLKQLLLADERQIARNLATQLTIYATGAAVSFSDRQQVEKMLDLTELDGFRVRSMIQQIVQSDLFRNK